VDLEGVKYDCDWRGGALLGL